MKKNILILLLLLCGCAKSLDKGNVELENYLDRINEGIIKNKQAMSIYVEAKLPSILQNNPNIKDSCYGKSISDYEINEVMIMEVDESYDEEITNSLKKYQKEMMKQYDNCHSCLVEIKDMKIIRINKYLLMLMGRNSNDLLSMLKG